MTEWICLKCHRVFHSKIGECCGDVEEFDINKHARRLIGFSNAWLHVWNKWRDNPKMREIANELAQDGCFSAATVLSTFIERLTKGGDE